MKGNLQGALADLVRATELAPKNLVYRQGLGFLKREMGDLDGAIIDFSRATETDPSDAYSRYILAVAKREKGDVAGAITDFDRAFELDPSYWDALIGRGTARHLNAEPALAVADLAQARKAGHHSITSLRYRLMLLRNGRRDIGEFQGHLDKMNDVIWPWPLVALYIFDQGTPASALGAAENKDPAVRKVQICQADFYIGQWQLLKDERANAVASLRNARDLCPKTVFEYTATVHELRRLGE